MVVDQAYEEAGEQALGAFATHREDAPDNPRLLEYHIEGGRRAHQDRCCTQSSARASNLVVSKDLLIDDYHENMRNALQREPAGGVG